MNYGDSFVFIYYAYHRQIQVPKKGDIADLLLSVPWHGLWMTNIIATVL